MRTKKPNRTNLPKGRLPKILLLGTVLLLLFWCTTVELAAHQPEGSPALTGDARLPDGRVRVGVWGLLMASGLLALFTFGGGRGEGRSGAAFEDTCRFFFEESPIANIILNSDGTIRNLNASGLAALGHRERSKLIGRSILEFVVPEHGPRLAHLLGERDGDVPPKAEVDILARGGPARTFLFSRCRAASSGKGDAAHALVAGVDVTDRELVREDELRSAQHLEFLSEAAMGFVELSPQEEVHRFIGQKLARLVPEAAYVIVNSIDREKRRLQVRCVLGSGKLVDLAARAIGRDPAGMSFDVHDEAWQGLSGGRLVRIPGGLYELAFGQVPKAVCSAVEKLADIGDIYVMGFSKKGEVYGSAAIMLRRGVRLTNQTVIETLMRQAGVALQRRQAEDELQKEREKLEWATENAGVGLAIISKDYRTLWANQVLKRMFGDVEGKPCHLTYNQRTEVCPGCGVRELFKTGKDQVVHEQVGKDKEGKTMWSQIIVTPVRDAQRNVTAALEAVVPITERKQNERLQGVLYRIAYAANTAGDLDELFRIIRKELMTILDTTNFFVALYDKKTDSLSLPYHVDQKDKFTSFPPGKTLTSWILRNDSPLLCTPEVRRRLLEAGEIEQTGTPSLAWLGVPLNVESETIGVLGVQSYSDPSAYSTREMEALQFASEQIALAIRRKQAEEALKRSERDYRGLFEGAHDAILIFEPEGETVLDVNHRACEIYGFERSEFVGMSLERISQDVPKGKEHIRLTLEKGSYHRFETVQYRKDRSRMFLEVNASVVDYMGRRAILSINRDITERKQAEEALRSSEQRYRLLFQQNLAGVYQTTLDGKVIDCNQSFARLLGYESAEQVLSRNASEFYFDHAERENFLSDLKSRGSLTDYEFRLRRKDGGAVWILENVNLIEGSGTTPTVIQGTAIDITQRKLAEEALRRSEDRYRSLFQDSPISLWEEDFSEVKRHLHHLRDTGISDFRRHFEDHPEEVARCAALVKVIDVNKDSMNLYQARSAEQLKSALDQIMAKEEYQSFREELIAITEGKTSFESEGVTYTLTGDKRHTMMKWTVLPGYEEALSRVVVAMTDVTAQRRAQEDLEEEKERYRNLFQTAPDSITILDTRGFVVSCNVATERLAGYLTGELVGKHFTELGVVRAKDLPRYLKLFGSIIRGKVPEPVEVAVLCKDGTVRQLEAHISLLRESGRITGIQVISRDTTERKRAEAQIRHKAILMDSISDAVITTDPGFTIQSWNSAAEDLYGWRASEVIGKRMGQVVPTEYVNNDGDAVLAQFQAEGFWRGEVVQKCRDGSDVCVLASVTRIRDTAGLPIGVLAINSDITERKRAEEALRESKERFQRIIENAPFGYYRVGKDGLWQYVNPVWERMHGLSFGDVVGKSFKITQTEDAVEKAREYVQRSLAGETITGEFSRLTKRGDIEYHSFNIQPVEQGDEIVAIEGFINDITERRRAEEALRESEERYRTYVENAPDGIFITDSDARYVDVNRAACGMTGYSRDELLNMSIMQLAPSDAPPEAFESFEELKRTGKTHSDIVIHRKDGSLMHASLDAVALSDGRYMAFCSDVTERKRAEEALRESEERFRAIVENAPFGYYRVGKDGLWQHVNPVWERMHGYSLKDVIGKPFEITQTTEDVEEARQLVKRALAGETIAGELSRATRQGTIEYHSFNIQPVKQGNEIVAIEGFINDITESKRAEQALRESEEKYRLVSENITVVVYSALPDEHSTNLFVSGKIEELTGYSDAEFLGNPQLFGEMIHPEDRHYVWKKVEEHRRKKGPLDVQYRIRTKDGVVKWIRDSATPMLDEEGRMTRINGFMEDVTERRLAEEALRESQERYRTLFGKTANPILVIDDQGNYIDGNQAALNFLEWTRDELLSKNIRDTIPPGKERQMLDKHLPLWENGGVVETEYYVGGAIKILELTITPSRWEDKRVIFGVGKDVTERKRAEEVSRESQAKLQSIFSAAPAGIGMTIDQTVKELNTRLCEITGYSKEELLGGSVSVVYPSDEDYHSTRREIYRQLTEKGSSTTETCWRGKDGRLIHVLLNCAPLEPGDLSQGITFAVLDITERKQAEEALRKSEERFRVTIMNSPVNVSCQDLDLRYTWIYNPQLGYSAEEVVSRTDIELLPPETAQTVTELKRRAIAAGARIREEVSTQYEGKTLCYDFTVEPLRDVQNKIVGVTNIVVDITERKRAEEALRLSEDKFSKAFHASPDVLVISRLSDGTIIEANDQWDQLFGYERGETIGRSSLEMGLFVNSEDRQRATTKLKEQDFVRDFEIDVRSKSDEIRRVVLSLEPIEINSEPCMLTIIHDITERKRAEEALRKSEEHHREAQRVARIGHWELIPEIGTPKWSDEIFRIFGLDPKHGEPSFAAHQNHIHPDDWSLLNDSVQKASTDGTPFDIEFRLQHPAKEIRWMHAIGTATKDENGKVTRLFGTAQDITNVKRAEEALRDSEERYRSIFNQARDGIILVDAETGQIADCNPEFENQTGRNSCALKKMYIWEVRPPQKMAAARKKFWEIVEAGAGDSSELEFQKPNGETVQVEFSARAVRIGDKKFIQSLVRDTTEKRKMEAQLIQAERLAAVGTLAYGIAHEFNNIVAGILGNAEFGMGNDDRQEVEECFRVIMENCDRARSITSHLLAFARRREAKKEMTDLTDTVESVLGLVERELQKENIKVKRSFDPVPEIFCDPGELSEVFLNMITNARDAMKPDGGTLAVSIGQKGDDLRVTFRDTGCGIPDSIKGRIFEPFVTTKGALGQSEIPGTGLGLFLSIGIVIRYHGRIDVESREGKGSTFTISLPISENQMTPGDVDAAREEPVSLPRNLRILLVDDEEPICNATRNSLETDGHFVVSTTSGKKGLRRFKAGAFDVVLCDITMPDMDGIKLMAAIKTMDPQVKLIAVTGHVQEDKLVAAKKAGADQILTKPFRKENLLKTMSRVLASDD